MPMGVWSKTVALPTREYLNGTRNSDRVTLPCLFDAARSGEGFQPQRTLVEVFPFVHVSLPPTAGHHPLVLGQIDCV